MNENKQTPHDAGFFVALIIFKALAILGFKNIFFDGKQYDVNGQEKHTFCRCEVWKLASKNKKIVRAMEVSQKKFYILSHTDKLSCFENLPKFLKNCLGEFNNFKHIFAKIVLPKSTYASRFLPREAFIKKIVREILPF